MLKHEANLIGMRRDQHPNGALTGGRIFRFFNRYDIAHGITADFIAATLKNFSGNILYSIF